MKKKIINDVTLDYLGTLYQELHQLELWLNRTPTSSDKVGRVYFVECGNYVKIGYTDKKDVHDRIDAFSTTNPHDIILLKSVKALQKHEDWLHMLCWFYHHRLEWFQKAEFVMSVIQSAEDYDGDNALGLRNIITSRISDIRQELNKRSAEDEARRKQSPSIADEIFRLMLRFFSLTGSPPIEHYVVARIFGYSNKDHRLAGIPPLPRDDRAYSYENVLAIWLKNHLQERGLPCGPLIERFATSGAWSVSAEIDNNNDSQIPSEWFPVQKSMIENDAGGQKPEK